MKKIKTLTKLVLAVALLSVVSPSVVSPSAPSNVVKSPAVYQVSATGIDLGLAD